ncbi:hypothetical protein Ae201684_015726 [Aphanomyces euteiches]|uniref:Uncharacterized protein n=1 Tax=Aphanomyces euteiches TaxID=100861 RepID=A0A6G0WGD0_9STRA|nr:hypothetical protein Ae201684_015726 [Aphanomyces euteiches]
MQKTGRKILDRNGRVVDEMKEDQILVRLHDPNNKDPATDPYCKVLRSNFKRSTINRIFKCNAHYLRDQFQNVIWPKEWLYEVRPPEPNAPWCYEIVEKDEPEPIDDGVDPRYQGSTVVKVANVPIQIQEKDLRAWLLAGLLQEYEPITQAEFDIAVLKKKRNMLKLRLDEVPMMFLSGTPKEQTEARQTLVKAMTTQVEAIDADISAVNKKLKRRRQLLLSEPIELSFLKDGTEHRFVDPDMENPKEKVDWLANFTSGRGQSLALLAIEKADWGELCLAPTRPEPTVSTEELPGQINMRTVRVTRVKHGQGDFFFTDVLPTEEDFHFSSIDAMYSGTWANGLKHDNQATEYTNYGIYRGAYVHNVRDGQGELVYGKGDLYRGTFDVPKSMYTFQRESYPRTLFPPQFRDGVPHGRGEIKFADGATYQGEMRDGHITGKGRYVSSTGVIEEGDFVDGMLHGQGYREEPNGHIEEGRFEHGVLDGYGTQHTKHNDSYDGSFDYGRRCGRGVRHLAGQEAAILTGFWDDDLPDGRGDLQYSRQVNKDRGGEVVEAPFLYEGTFSQGKVKCRHRHIDVEKVTSGHVPFTTNGKNSTHMPFPTNLVAVMTKQSQRHTRNSHRRQQREATYLANVERANLQLYYTLLDEFYEAWADHIQGNEMTLEKQREMARKKGNVKSLQKFPTYLERVPLTVRDKIAAAKGD